MCPNPDRTDTTVGVETKTALRIKWIASRTGLTPEEVVRNAVANTNQILSASVWWYQLTPVRIKLRRGQEVEVWVRKRYWWMYLVIIALIVAFGLVWLFWVGMLSST